MLKKIILWIIVVLALLLAVLALTINPLLSWSSGKAFNKFAPEIIGAPTHVDSVSVSVYQGRVQIDDLLIGNPEGFTADRALSLDEMVLKIAPSSLLGPTLRVEEISIDDPTIVLEYANGKTNFGEIQKHLKSRRPAKDTASPGISSPAADAGTADSPGTSGTAADSGEATGTKSKGRKLSVNRIALTDADVEVIFNGKSYKVESPDIILENVAPNGVTPAELSLLILEKLMGQIQIDATQLPDQIGKQITDELDKQLEQAGEQGRSLLKQLEQESGVQTDALRNLLGR